MKSSREIVEEIKRQIDSVQDYMDEDYGCGEYNRIEMDTLCNLLDWILEEEKIGEENED